MDDDDRLASLVATDLRRNLEARAADVRDVYGVCLWTDDYYGYFLGSLATESRFESRHHLPGYPSIQDPVTYGPAGVRWSVGDWHQFPDDEFVTDETKAALASLVVSELSDDDYDDAGIEAAAARWREITFAALELAQPLDVLPCTDYAIAFASFADRPPVEQAEAMLRTVPASRFHATFPAWRRIAQLVESVRSDEAQIAHLRERVTEMTDEGSSQSSADELRLQLRACGLSWNDVETGSYSWQRALILAAQE